MTPTRTTPASGLQTPLAEALARCVAPLGAADFLDRHWEREPLFVERDEPGRFDDLLSEDDVHRLVTSGGLRHPAFRLVKAGARLSVRDYTTDISWRPTPFTGMGDVERIAELFADGATIVLQGLHHHWHPLAVFSRRLEGELGHPVQVNAYYTPRRSQGLAVHHDTHDVFVLQVAGEKRWLVYEPAWELPLKNQRYDAEMGGPGDVVHDVSLRAGDTLYLPRGWMHEALTSDTDSLHLTVGINVYSWIDAFKAALAECESDVEFRRAPGPDGEGADELVERLAERLSPATVARRMRRKLVRTRRPIREGQLHELRLLEGLTAESRLERRPTVLFDLRGTTLSFEGRDIHFPDRVAEELEYLATADEPFTAADLPGSLDEPGRLVLFRRLVREGFLRFSPPHDGGAASPRSGGDAAARATST